MNLQPSQTASAPAASDWLAGGGEMGELVRSMDWSKTPLGPIESWPQSLRTTVSLCLASNFPISLAWGPNHVQIYNDGYWPICGGKHPHSMGQDFSECWASAWPVIGEVFARALAGETSYLENQRMFLDRNGYLEETFFTFSFSPIRDESGGVGGLFHPVTETTSRMLSERRTRALRDLTARTGKAQTCEEAFRMAAQTLSSCDLDLPFVLIYAVDGDGKSARLAAGSGLAAGTSASPEKIDLTVASACWALDRVIASGIAVQMEELEKEFGAIGCGPYPEPPKTALVLPITPPGAERPSAVLIAGISPRLPFDELYRGFCEQVATALTASLANALAYEEERRRAEKLAELDRAKTTFFSNVSHEFRTPLMLMLGPLEEALAEAEIPPEQRQRLDIAHRNSLRLLKLVNILLDFSRIEAGRIQATYEPLDLAEYTSDLASVFRSAIEKAGMELVVDCPQLSETVFVDRDMWEKIVLNLLSNAFKFTEQGRIAVRQRIVGGDVELAVEDTGCGIPADQLDNIFKRFHRIEGARGRTHEGTGIGLALVLELAKLHGGTVRVASVEGGGSTFTVTLPLGNRHLPLDRITAESAPSTTDTRKRAYLEEALHWLPDAGQMPEQDTDERGSPGTTAVGPRPRVLLADDNADMREYVRRILAAHYEVCVVPDGEAALAAVRERKPDVVLSDIMMPGLDGFGLLRELRDDPDTSAVPVIFLSARAGEESRLEGLEAGADDYLVKPFSSRELLARVRSNLELAGMRSEVARREQEALDATRLFEAVRESEEKYRTLFESIDEGFCIIEVIFDESGKPVDYRFLESNPAFERQTGLNNAMGRTVRELVPAHEEHWFDVYGRIALSGEPVRFENLAAQLYRWYDVYAWRHGQAQDRQVAILFKDITERKLAEEGLKSSLHEKEVLLKEVHHRVKNNLQVISSLIGLQADGSKDETVREVLKDVTFRVRSMALVHEKLYQSADLAQIDFGEYTRSLMNYLWRAHGAVAANIRLTLNLEPVSLPVDTAVPCGLILNELAGNALKHAFKEQKEGEVTVALHGDADGRIRLSVADNGIGLPEGLDLRQAKTLGLRLVQMLAKQLDAGVEAASGNGTKFEIVFTG